MKILMFCHKMPFPLNDGGSHAIFHNALGFIQNNVNLRVFALNTPKDWVEIKDFPENFIKKTNFECVSIDTRIKPWNAFLNLFSNKSYFVERFYSKPVEAKLIQILSTNKFDLIQLEHLYMCLYIDTIRKYSTAKIILRSQNVEHVLRKRYLENNQSLFSSLFLKIATNRLASFEKKAVNKLDGIIALTSLDEEEFKKICNNIPTTVIALGYDLSKTDSLKKQKMNNSNVIYHLGSMDWLPNVQGIDWFIKYVLPLLIKKHPEIEFRIAGKKMPQKYYTISNKNLIVDGDVKDSLEYQRNMPIMIVPLLSGGGIRVKIIEGMAIGKTIISTSIGAEGIPATNNKNILLADTPGEFEKQISRCLASQSFCEEIGANARKMAIEKFSCTEIAERVLTFFTTL